MYTEKELDIAVQFNEGSEIPVHLVGPGLLGACRHVMSSSGATSYDGQIRLTVGIFDCHHTNDHAASFGKSVWVIVDHQGHSSSPNECSGQIHQHLGENFDEGNWDNIYLSIPLPPFHQGPLEPKIERPPLRVKIKRVGKLVVRKFEVSGHRRRRVYTPVP